MSLYVRLPSDTPILQSGLNFEESKQEENFHAALEDKQLPRRQKDSLL